MKRSFFTAVLLALSLTSSVAAASPLTIVETIGGDDGDLFLHNPIWINYADDGTMYMLNAGECQVLHLTQDWELLNSFGKCGEGPGEFANPTGLVLYKDKVWVFEQARITVYEEDGTYVRTILPGTQYAAPVILDDRIVVRMGSGERSAAYLDDDGKVTDHLGLDCPVDFFESFKTCRNTHMLPHEDGKCVILNMVSGQVHLIGDDGYPTWTRSVIKMEDDSVTSTSDDGESRSISLSLGMGMGCLDSSGRYWVPVLSQEEDGATEIVVLAKDFKTEIARFLLPDGIYCWQMSAAPNGQMYLVSTMESTVYVCDVDGGL